MSLTTFQTHAIENWIEELAAAAGVPAPTFTATSGGTVAAGRDNEGVARIWIGVDWFALTTAIEICQCGHTHRNHLGKRSDCQWLGCDCSRLTPDRQRNRDIRERTLRALIAHEIGHLGQEKDGMATKGLDAEYDADARAASLVGSDVMTEAIIYADAWRDPDGDVDHPSGPERAAALRRSGASRPNPDAN